jgi:3-oxoacyl-[acyl-carrier protein] reductase
LQKYSIVITFATQNLKKYKMTNVSKKLQGKNAIVTGGSRGIGRSIVTLLAAQGANVLFTFQKNEEAANEVESLAKGSKAVKTDMRNLADINQLFADANAHFNNKIDIVILNAFPEAILKPTVMISESDYDALFNGTKGNFFLLQNAAKNIADGGRIIMVSSGAAGMAGPAGGAYGGAKSAVERFTLSLAKELGSRKVAVNVVAPGVTETEGLVAPKHIVDYLITQIPMGRLGQPDEVANAVVLLTMPEAGWISAQIVRANGGLM